MSQVTVSEEALRQLVREALDGGHLGDLTMPDDKAEEPVNVNPVVDPSAAETDPSNPNFVPQTKPELDVALHCLVKDLPIDRVPSVYKAINKVVTSDADVAEQEKEMKKAEQGGTIQVEEAIRRQVRKILSTMTEAPSDLPPVKKIPPGVHGGEYMRRFQKVRDAAAERLSGSVDEPEEVSDETGEEEGPKKRKAYKTTALGNMADVSGASFEDIANDLGFSVAGAKQAVDKALEKARFLATMDSDDREILVLTTMNDYIKMLSKSGELSAADVQLMKDHPDIVRELDGFREFMHNAIRRARKGGMLEDPMGEGKQLPKVNEARHGKKIDVDGVPLILDTKDPEWFILKTQDGEEVARQAKRSSGRVYRQGTNPDYEGRESFRVEFKKQDGEWHTWDDQGHKGELFAPDFLDHVVEYMPKALGEIEKSKPTAKQRSDDYKRFMNGTVKMDMRSGGNTKITSKKKTK